MCSFFVYFLKNKSLQKLIIELIYCDEEWVTSFSNNSNGLEMRMVDNFIPGRMECTI